MARGKGFTRSASLERDRGAASIHSYVPTVRVLELIERLTDDLERGTGGAYSIIGPYGSGKSSAALFIEALFGPVQEVATKSAIKKLRSSNAELARRFLRAKKPWEGGFTAVSAAAQREPVAASVLRALRAAEPRITRVPSEVHLVEWLKKYTASQPTMLVLDEFGKNLEFYAQQPAESDLYLLQQLAERAVDPTAAPFFILTLQHLAFEEYLSLSAPTVQREWAKIQGRFADVPFAETPRQVRRLIASALNVGTDSRDGATRGAPRHVEWLRKLDLDASIESPDEVVAVYPLHPTVVAALPELCARFAQNERTLFSFLRSTDPHSVAHHLEKSQQRSSGEGLLPLLKLDTLYDYFVESARSQLMAARGARRWLEIESRIRDASSVLTPQELSVLKAVGVLNLVSSGGKLRASRDVVAYACADEPGGREATKFTSETLQKLVDGQILTYRQFAGEYRIWSGSDFDLTAAYDQAQREVEGLSTAAMLEAVRPRSPLVAGKFSIETGVLRSFDCRYADQYSDLDTLQPSAPGADGVLVLWVGERPPKTLVNCGPRPVVLALPQHARVLRASAVEVAAYRRVLERHKVLEQDWVARRELVERLLLGEQRLDGDLWSTFEADRAEVQYLRLGREAAEPLALTRATRVISAEGAHAYPAAPFIRNEVIGRQELTSQGAAARRVLVEAMVDRAAEESLGLTGYGPEYAIYLALLKDSGIHRHGEKGYYLGAPKRNHSFVPVWRKMEQALEESHFQKINVSDLMERVSRPPYGLRQGPFFVLFPAMLLARLQELAVYEQGVFQPAVAPDLLERMTKNPEKFDIRSFGLQKGRRSDALRACVKRFELTTPAEAAERPSVLSVVRPLLNTYRSFPEFSHHTKAVSKTARDVREALTGAKEPDQLLFVALPHALGMSAFGAGGADSGPDPDEFADALSRHLRELRDCYGQTLGELQRLGAELLGVRDQQFREVLRSRSTPLVRHAGHPDVRSFLLVASDTAQENQAWFENLAMNLSSKAPRIWRDDDVVVFKASLRARIGALQRLEFLYDDREAQQASKPYRICLTQADGSELALLGYGHERNAALQRLVERTIKEARRLVDRGADAALVRLLLEHLGEGSDARALRN